MTAETIHLLAVSKETKKRQPLTTHEHLSGIAVATTLALAMSSAMMNTAHAEENVTNVDTLVIEETAVAADANPYAEANAPYKAKRLSDVKHTRDIADTPQTMTVMTKELIEDSGKTELKDILSAQPGITLGTGEGGNSFGDRYIIRGYEARSDVFTDGLREPGLITRETFAIEQVEISKGPSSTFAGRGSTGGSVNVVTKKASLDDDFTTLEAGVGTDKYNRYSVDTNKVIGDRFAVRMNALYSDADIPARGPAKEQRKGMLLSGVFEATDDLTLSADYYYFESDDRTDPGVQLDRATGAIDTRIKNIGQSGLDFHDTKASIFTTKVDWSITDNIRVENKTRFGNANNAFIVSAYNAGFDAGIRPFNAWQRNQYFGNQTNVLFDQNIWGMKHSFVSGIEYAKENVSAGNYTVTTDASVPMIDPYAPDNSSWSGTISKNDSSKNEIKTISAYLMDTVTLSEDWEVFAGLRYDHFDYSLITTSDRYQFSDGLWNGHLGVVFSPWEKGNVYVSVSTSSNINGGEADAGTNCGYGGLCTDSNGNYNSKPEISENIEVGTKWNLFDDNLLLTAALFQTTKRNVIEGGVDSYQSGGSLNTGENRVEGIELGLSGNITPKLSGQIGLAMMNSETLDSYFDGTKAATGRGGVISYPDYIGRAKANFAKRSVSAQLKYKFTPKFNFGGNLTYSSGMLGGQPDAGSSGQTTIRTPSYTVFDLFASYQVNEQLGIRANIQNVTDKDYYTAIYRGGDIIYIGDARSANVNLTYKF
jgi:catecholate siderophore receptor